MTKWEFLTVQSHKPNNILPGKSQDPNIDFNFLISRITQRIISMIYGSKNKNGPLAYNWSNWLRHMFNRIKA